MPFSICPFHRLPLASILGFWLVLTLLLLSSGPAYAEWVKFANNEEGDVTYYIDPESIDAESLRREGNFVEVSVLLDYSTSQTDQWEIPYLSSKAQFVCDCDEEKWSCKQY